MLFTTDMRGKRFLGSAILGVVIFLSAFANPAFGQQATGAINGTVTDANGAVMAGVTVTLHNDDTGIDMPEKTNDAGFYSAPLLQPGTYDVTGAQAGFSTVQHKNISVQVGQTIGINIQMPVASQQQVITVTTEAPLIETEKTDQSQNVSENLVSNLPTSARRWEQFVFLTPGVAADGASGLIGFHGINSQYNNNSVDGANNNNSYNGGDRGRTIGLSNDGYAYSGDSIREFQVGTSNFTVEVGQAAGGAVNAVTKSGTSQFHGDAFYNGRSSYFNAFDPVTKAKAASAIPGTSASIPANLTHQQNQWGGSLGGPIVKDKLFFFATWDSYRKILQAPVTTTQLVPPISSFGCPQVAAFPNGGGGSLVGGANTNQAIMNTMCGNALHYVFTNVLGNFPENLRQDIGLLKLDYQLNAKNHLNAVANIRDWNEKTLVNQNGGPNLIWDRFIIATWNTVIGADKVNELRYQWSTDKSLNTTNNFPPSLSLANLFTEGLAAVFPVFTFENRNQVSDNFSFNKGTHAFKAGFDYNYTSDLAATTLTINGTYSYSGTPGALPAGVCPTTPTTNITYCQWMLDLYHLNIGDNLTGLHWINFSQTYDRRFGSTTPNTQAGIDAISDTDYAAYFQDTWKARPNLTVNLGLRYDIQLLPQLPSPNDHTPLLAQYTETVNIDKGGIQPRVGAAWNVAKDTVIRGGVGIFFAKTAVSAISAAQKTSGIREQTFSCTLAQARSNPTGVSDPCLGLTSPNPLVAQTIPPQAPFTVPGLPANQEPANPVALGLPANADSCLNNPGCNVRGLSPNLLNPRAYEGELAIERRLPGNLSFTGSYIFTRGNRLPAYYDVNEAPNTVTKSYDVLAGSTGTPASSTITLPFFTQRINPTTGAILAINSVVNSTYNAMVLSVRRPTSHGLELLLNYTLSKADDDGQSSSLVGGETYFGGPGVLNPYDIKAEEGPSGTDNRHRFTGSLVWAPPIGNNLSNMFARAAVRGWQVSTTVTATTGIPYTATMSSSAQQCANPALSAAACAAAGLLGLDGGVTGASSSTSAANAAGRLPFVPRNSFYLPGYTVEDMRISKQFSLRERYHFEFRVEAFNMFNSTIVQAVSTAAYSYVAPGTGVCAGHANTCLVPGGLGFQTPSTTTGVLLGPRQLQAGFRFEF